MNFKCNLISVVKSCLAEAALREPGKECLLEYLVGHTGSGTFSNREAKKPLNGSPDNGSLRLLFQLCASPIL